jgi:hypothetical protein
VVGVGVEVFGDSIRDDASVYRFLEPLVYIWDCAEGGKKEALEMKLGLLGTVMGYE